MGEKIRSKAEKYFILVLLGLAFSLGFLVGLPYAHCAGCLYSPVLVTVGEVGSVVTTLLLDNLKLKATCSCGKVEDLDFKSGLPSSKTHGVNSVRFNLFHAHIISLLLRTLQATVDSRCLLCL